MNATPKVPAMVIGVGASAGGLQAFEAFLSGIPETDKFAYVLVQHLSPDHESALSRLLQPSTSAGVDQIEDGMAVEAGHVYVIPPGKLLRVSDNAFQLSEPNARRRSHSTVDVLLRSLASEYESAAGCVILSGTGSDGALGLKAVKEAGGVCLVQDPAEAEYPGMPHAAVDTGLADVVAPVTDLGSRLAAYVNMRAAQEAGASGASPSAADDAPDETLLQDVFTLLDDRTGQDFAPYRRGTVVRRISHRMRLRQIESMDDYVALLERDDEECHLLARDFLISVTSFFRDTGAFESLASTIIPRLFEDKTGSDTIRLWVAGCATGEEAYSLLMLLEEHRATLSKKPRIQIFASDVDESALARGRDGFYPSSIVADVSEERLGRFFDAEEGGYRIQPKVRDQVIFARHNLLQDPPFLNVDLISCRNLLIYLKRDVQERVVDLFHYALKPKGHLFLGRSETAHSVRSMFAPVEDASHVFRAHPEEEDSYTYPLVPIRGKALSSGSRHQRGTPSIQSIHRSELAKRHLPPSVLVGPDFEACHLLGEVGDFLRIEPGLPPRSILQMVPPKLRTELRSALKQAVSADVSRTIRYVRLSTGADDDALVDVFVEPVHPEDAPHDTYALVTFRPHPEFEEDEEDEPVPSGGDDAGEDAGSTRERGAKKPKRSARLNEARRRVDHLETELESVRHRLQTVTEEYETSTEELLASNEELEAANEELRATTEELEMSREEIESTNEELLTLNRELQAKVERLNRMNSDLQNLMEATDIATIFLDDDLCLRQFTERATHLFNLISTDAGRPFEHVSHRLEDDDIAQDAARVLKELSPVAREMQSESGEWFKMRILPYRTVDNRIDGVLITLVDVTDLKEAEQRVEEMNAKLEERVQKRTEELAQANDALQAESTQREKARDHFRRLFRLGPVAGVITTLSEGRIVDVNQRYLALTGYDREDLIDERVTEVGLLDAEDRASRVEVLMEEGRLHSQEVRLGTREDDHVDMMFSSEIIERDGTPLILSLGVNITARKKAEALMRKARDEAEAMNQLKTSFIANMSHEIRTPLTGIIGFADVLGELVDGEEAQRYIRYVRANGKRLLETLDSVLDLARLDAEEIRLQPTPVDLRRFTEETGALFELRAKDKQLTLSVHTPDDPVRVELDTSLLQRVLNNLIDNALKFTEDGTVTLRLSTVEATSPDQQIVTFAVSDTGVGMSESFQNRLYQEFTQERGGTDRPQEGAGLGLAITHRLISLMDGEIAIDSTEGEGTTATVTLPCRTVQSEDSGEDAVANDSQSLRRPDGSPPKVLVVDDRPEVGIIAGKFLSDCDVERVESASDGIEAVSREAFDVVLLDIQLGAQGTGPEVLQAIRNLPARPSRRVVPTDVPDDVPEEAPSNGAPQSAAAREKAAVEGTSPDGQSDGEDPATASASTARDVPVMALTAHSLPGDRQRFLDDGFDAYLGKPFSREGLRRAVRDLLEDHFG